MNTDTNIYLYARPQTLRIIDNFAKLVELHEEDSELHLNPRFIEEDHLGHSSIYRGDSSNANGGIENIALIAKGIFALFAIICGFQWVRDRGNIAADLESKEAILRDDQEVWIPLQSIYNDEYNSIMRRAFSAAHRIIQARKPEEQYIKVIRISLLAFVIIGAIGWCIASRTLQRIGFSYCIAASLCLCIKYGKNAYEEWKNVNNLKDLVRKAKRERDLSEIGFPTPEAEMQTDDTFYSNLNSNTRHVSHIARDSQFSATQYVTSSSQ